MLDVFAPAARLAVIHAGMTAADLGQPRLNDRSLLLALAEGEPLAHPVELGVTASCIRALIEARAPRRRDRELRAVDDLDAELLRLGVRANQAVHPIAIGDRDRSQPEPVRLFHQLLGVARALEEREVRLAPKRRVLAHVILYECSVNTHELSMAG